MKTLLITGSGGFVGKNLKEYFQDKYNILSPRSNELNLINEEQVKKYFDTICIVASMCATKKIFSKEELWSHLKELS